MYSYPYAAGAAFPMPSTLEESNIRKHYRNTFLLAILHSFLALILSQTFFYLIPEITSYSYRYDENDYPILDWQYLMIATFTPAAACLIVFLVDKCISKVKFSEYFSAKNIRGKDIGGMILVLCGAFSLAMIIQLIVINVMGLAGLSPVPEIMTNATEDVTPAYLAVDIFTSLIVAPVCEELMFRGVILRRMSQVSMRFGIVFSAVCFGLMHGNILQGISGFIVGLVLAYADIKCGSVIPSIIGHMFLNSWSCINALVSYFTDEDTADMVWLAIIAVLGLVGLISILVLVRSRKIRLPEYNEYHKKRSFRLAAKCVSFWILMIIYAFDVISAFSEVSEKT